MSNDFDTLDLCMLAATIAEGTTGNKNAPPWSQGDCEEVQSMAEMLHRVWQGIDEEQWNAVFVYEVTEPVGEAVARRIVETGEPLSSLHDYAEQVARECVAEAMRDHQRALVVAEKSR